MGKYVKRIVSTSFWEDSKVVDRFSAEDKYFMLYLMTNPHTTQAGIFKLPYRIAGFETGYTTEVIKVLLDRFQSKYGVIAYSTDTQEVAVLNSLKYSIVKGGKPLTDCIKSDLNLVESNDLIIAVYQHLKDWWSMSERNVDKQIRDIFATELQRRKVPKEVYDNDNDNDNDNEESYHDSYHDSSTNRDVSPSNNSSHQSLSVNQLKDEFEKLWEAYPNKKGKKSAFNHYKAWRKESAKHTPEHLMQRLDAFKKYWTINHTPKQYIMYGSTWFNGRFDDELDIDQNKYANHGGFDPRLFDDSNMSDIDTKDLPF